MRDFSEASPPTDIGSSGDTGDVLASLNDVSERREVSVEDLMLLSFAVTPIFDALTDGFEAASASSVAAPFSGGTATAAAATSGLEPEPVGAFSTDTSTS